MFEKKYLETFSNVTASEETYRRIMNMEKNKQCRTGITTKILIAAVLISLLAVTASASEMVRNWFDNYFGSQSNVPLSQEQVVYIETNEKHHEESQRKNQWTIHLCSTLTDGMKGYIVLGISAPEKINLEEIVVKSEKEYYGPGNDFLLKSENAVLHCSAYPDFGGVLGTIGSRWVNDGDGLSNTVNYIIDVVPDAEWAEEDPFGENVDWNIHIENLVCGFPEQTILAEGSWDFTFTFDYDKSEVNLLNEPMKIRAWALPGNGTEVETRVTVTSMVLRPFGITLYYGDDGDGLDYSRTSVNFIDSAEGKYAWFVVMKNGSKIELSRASGNPIERCVYLESQLPIVLEDVDHLLLNDGTLLSVSE